MHSHVPQVSAPVPETSSIPTVIPPEQEDLFRGVLSLFEKHGISYAVAGAFALRAHTGICRDTKDLDVFLTTTSATRALATLREEGFECEICDPVWLYKARRDSFFVDLITGMSNAAIVVDDSWMQRSVPAVVYGIRTQVLAPEELLASKLFVTRRERFDGADIAHVIYATQGKLDWQRIFHLVGEHWEMLLWALILYRYSYPAQSEYVPSQVWNELLTRFRETIVKPDPKAAFRGSLVDDKMFAIDVNEWGHSNLMEQYRRQRLRDLAEND